MAALPLQLATAPLPEEVPGRCCYAGSKDCDGSQDWCSKDESHCTRCGGTFHANQEAAPKAAKKAEALMLAAAPAAQQPQQPEQPQEQNGDWKHYVPAQYR